MLYVGTGDTPETLEALGAEYMEGVLVVAYPRNDITEAYRTGREGLPRRIPRQVQGATRSPRRA